MFKEADDQFSKKLKKQSGEGALLEKHTTSLQNSGKIEVHRKVRFAHRLWYVLVCASHVH